jgi:hypothetical protein
MEASAEKRARNKLVGISEEPRGLVRRVEHAPVEFVRGLPVGAEIGNAVPARVEMEFVRDFQGIQRLVQFARTVVEALEILGATISSARHLA